ATLSASLPMAINYFGTPASRKYLRKCPMHSGGVISTRSNSPGSWIWHNRIISSRRRPATRHLRSFCVRLNSKAIAVLIGGWINFDYINTLCPCLRQTNHDPDDVPATTD